MADNTHETKIEINGDAKGAVSAMNGVRGAISKVQTALLGVRQAVSRVMLAFGVFGLVMQGVTALVNGFNWLKDKITETSREIAKMRFDAIMERSANATKTLVGMHERLSKLMKEELDTLSKQRTLDEIERQGALDYDDGRRAADRARQIYEAKTPEEEQALRDRFAAEDEQIARRRAKDARKDRISQLDREESVYSGKAAGLRHNNAEIDRQIETERFNLRRANGNEEYSEQIRKRLEALRQRKEANDQEIAQYEKEARFRRDQIAALESQKDYEGPTAGEWQRKTEAKKRAAAEEEKARKEAENKERESQRQANEFVRGYEEDQARDRQQRANELGGLVGREASFDGVSQNRLTAMGLGSGVSGSGGVASDVKKLVDLLKEEVEESKKLNEKDYSSGPATFAE